MMITNCVTGEKRKMLISQIVANCCQIVKILMFWLIDCKSKHFFKLVMLLLSKLIQ